MNDGVTAKQIMTSDVIGVLPKDTVRHALAQLLEHSISGMPVVSEAGRPVGIVTEEDLVALLYEKGDAPGVIDATLEASRVWGEPLITLRPVFVTPETPRTDIARRLIMNRIKRVPVVDRHGVVVGVVNRRDILRSVQSELWPVGDE